MNKNGKLEIQNIVEEILQKHNIDLKRVLVEEENNNGC